MKAMFKIGDKLQASEYDKRSFGFDYVTITAIRGNYYDWIGKYKGGNMHSNYSFEEAKEYVEPNFKKAHYRAIPVYYNPMTEEIEGRNWFYKICLDVAIWFDTEVLQLDAFPLWVEVSEEEIKHMEEVRRGFK